MPPPKDEDGLSALNNALSDAQKAYLWQKFGRPGANMIRTLERQAVSGDSHRLIEVTTQCLHTLAADLLTAVGIAFIEAEVGPSVYGENGSGEKR